MCGSHSAAVTCHIHESRVGLIYFFVFLVSCCSDSSRPFLSTRRLSLVRTRVSLESKVFSSKRPHEQNAPKQQPTAKGLRRCGHQNSKNLTPDAIRRAPRIEPSSWSHPTPRLIRRGACSQMRALQTTAGTRWPCYGSTFSVCANVRMCILLFN